VVFRGEAIPKATTDRSGGEIAKDYSAGTSVIHFQILFQCIAEEGNHPWEAYERTGAVGRRTLWRDPTMQRLWSGVL